MSRHTPTPYAKVVKNNGSVFIADKAGELIFEATGFKNDGANADFIVKAVNNHDALVAALRQYRNWIVEEILDRGLPQERIDNPPLGSHLGNAKAALTAVKEGKS